MTTDSLIWRKVIWRQWRKEPKVPILLIGILALGVAVFLSVRLANRAAVSGFSLFTESISGEADLILRPQSGRFSDSKMSEISQVTGSLPVQLFPVFEATVLHREQPMRLVGTDLVSLPNLASLSESNPGSPIASSLQDGPIDLDTAAFISEEYAANESLTINQVITVNTVSGPQELKLADLLKNDPLRPSIPRNLLLMDLSGAQALAQSPASLSRIDIYVPEGASKGAIFDQVSSRLATWADSHQFILETPGQRKATATQMSAAFRLNLTILSSLALLVGTYLILQSMEASVIRRRSEIAMLRCLGITPRQVLKVWLAESLVLGVIGSVLGVLFGLLCAERLLA
ncbi:MAG: FtsX-like permease family protein, partial [Verrucomicrobiota bacterium]